jgi:hypothetical protein
MDTVSEGRAPAGGTKQIILRVVAFVMAAGLLYFAFAGTDFAQAWKHALTANPLYIAIMCIVCLLGHILRAWRWIYLLEPIGNRKVSLWNSFCAVILGYAVNVPIPRGGEVVRLVSLSKSEKLPWAGVLPTMLIDRMLDLVMLGLLIGLTLALLPGNLVPQAVVSAGVLVAVGSIAGLVALPWMGKFIRIFLGVKLVGEKLPQAVATKLQALAGDFEIGTKSLTNMITWPLIAGQTVAIWVCYWLQLYMGVFAFHLEGQIDAVKSLTIFAISSVSVLIPTPGSVGTYHAAVKEALITIGGLPKDGNLAVAFASVVHIFGFILVPCITAAICIGIQSSSAAKSQKA